MSMNRQTRRALQKQGQLGPDGEPAAPSRSQQQRTAAAASRPDRERTGPVQFVREVRAELRKVAWPTRAETIRFSIIVAITLVVLTMFIFLLDYGAAKAVFFLFD